MAHRQNIIVVSVAYRLGVFGYMHNEAFLSEDGVMGNFASLDQRAALQWVNQHIASIGGDPTDVTITGCSAGGQSVLVHLTSPQSWPYFQKALTFSAPIGLPYKTKEEVTPFYNQIIENLSCCKNGDCTVADLDCLRSKTTKEIQRASWNRGEMRPDNFPEMATQAAEPFSPVIDGQLLTDQPGNLIARGELRPHTPIFHTIQEDEGEMFVNLLFPHRKDSKRLQITPSQWREMVHNVYGNNETKVEQVLEQYQPPCDNEHLASCDCGQHAKDWLTDYTWICPFRAFMTNQIRSTNPFYAFMMTSTLPHGYWKTPVRIFRSCIDSDKSCHCSDSILYFGMARERWEDDPDELDDGTENYIDLLQQIVGNFVRTGNPNDYTNSPTQHPIEPIWPYHQKPMVSCQFRIDLQSVFIRFSSITSVQTASGLIQHVIKFAI